MKKKSLVLLCTLLLASAPGAYANDDSAPGLLDALLSRLVAILSSDAPEPLAQPLEDSEPAPPPNSSSATSSEPEMGWQIPPGG